MVLRYNTCSEALRLDACWPLVLGYANRRRLYEGYRVSASISYSANSFLQLSIFIIKVAISERCGSFSGDSGLAVDWH